MATSTLFTAVLADTKLRFGTQLRHLTLVAVSGIDDQEILAKALGQPGLIVSNLSNVPQPQNVNNLSTVQQPQKLSDMGIVHLGKCRGVSLKYTLNGHLAEFTKIAEAASHSKIYHMSILEVNLFED